MLMRNPFIELSAEGNITGENNDMLNGLASEEVVTFLATAVDFAAGAGFAVAGFAAGAGAGAGAGLVSACLAAGAFLSFAGAAAGA